MSGKKKACVIGGTGYVASFLIKLLLEKGYIVNTTVRDPGNEIKISHLLALQGLGKLKIFKADLTDEGSFDSTINGCEFVFLVATPVNFDSQDPENDMIKPSVKGVTNVLTACSKAKSVKRVVMTSSAAAVSINNLIGDGLVMTEDSWTDVDFLYSEKAPLWGYPVSKTLAEREAWKLAKENNIDLVTVIPSLISGASITPNVPSSIGLAACLLTGNESLINGLKGMQILSGSISITHIEDVCRAHIFVAEKETAKGRYICCAINTNVLDLAKFLCNRYPHSIYNVPNDISFQGLTSKTKSILSSQKLINEGFQFECGIEEIYDSTVEYLKSKGVLD